MFHTCTDIFYIIAWKVFKSGLRELGWFNDKRFMAWYVVAAEVEAAAQAAADEDDDDDDVDGNNSIG